MRASRLGKRGAASSLALLAACALLTITAPAHAQTDRVQRLISVGVRLHEAGRLVQAERQIRRAQQLASPEDGRPALALAALLPEEVAAPVPVSVRQRAARSLTALDTFLAAAPLDPLAATATRARAWSRALSGDHQRAIRNTLSAAGLQDRENATLLRRLALLAIVRDDLASARQALAGAHRAYPQDSAILSELAAVALALGDPDAAAESYQRVLGRDPQDLGARRDLAGALVAAGRPAGAVTLLSETLEQHPDELDLWLELSHAALEAADHETAARAATQAVSRATPRDGRAHAALGSARAAQGRLEEAEDAFTEAVRRDPNELRASQGLETLRQGATSP